MRFTHCHSGYGVYGSFSSVHICIEQYVDVHCNCITYAVKINIYTDHASVMMHLKLSKESFPVVF